MSDWATGFASGVGATIVGFICTMLWDIFKHHRDVSSRSNAVIGAVRQDLEENLAILLENREFLNHEVSALAQGQELIPPLKLLNSSFWEIVKLERPEKLVSNTLLFGQLQELSQLISYLNDCVQARQIYKLNNAAMSNYFSLLKRHDEILLLQFEQLRSHIDEPLAELQKI